MPNIKSAKKRVLVSAKATERNKSARSKIRTAVKKLKAMVEANDAAVATYYPEVVRIIDQAVAKGVYHKNTAARKQSQLARLINK